MQLLLDTHVYLWLLNGDSRLTSEAKLIIEGADAIFISAATIWELAIKVRLGKLRADLDELIEQIHANGFEELPVYARHARGVLNLPPHHGDPFDRLLIAQAISETMRLLTADTQLRAYSDLVECI